MQQNPYTDEDYALCERILATRKYPAKRNSHIQSNDKVVGLGGRFQLILKNYSIKNGVHNFTGVIVSYYDGDEEVAAGYEMWYNRALCELCPNLREFAYLGDLMLDETRMTYNEKTYEYRVDFIFDY